MLESEYWALAVSMGLRTLDEAIFFAIGDAKTNLGVVYIYSDGTGFIIDNNIPVPVKDTEVTIIEP